MWPPMLLSGTLRERDCEMALTGRPEEERRVASAGHRDTTLVFNYL